MLYSFASFACSAATSAPEGSQCGFDAAAGAGCMYFRKLWTSFGLFVFALAATLWSALTDRYVLVPAGAAIGTGAVRRIAQLHALGLQLQVTPIRGNVDSRIARVLGPEADLDAVVLARAGVVRLGRAAEITETLDPMLMLPAPAQGALAIECRSDDADLVELLAALDHAPSRAAVTAERAMLATLEAGCSAPVAAHAELAEGEHGDEIYLRGAVISPDGSRAIRLSRTGTPADAAEIGKALAADLLDAGADTLMGSTE